jgi:hypothetical protein
MPATTPNPPPRFDQVITGKLYSACQQILLEHPDTVRTVGVFIDYREPLNRLESIQHGLWVGVNGDPERPEEIFGGAIACIQVLEAIVARASALKDQLQHAVTTHLHHLQKAAHGQKAKTDQGAEGPPES